MSKAYKLTAAEEKALGSALRRRHFVVYNELKRDKAEGGDREDVQQAEAELAALESAAIKLVGIYF